MDFCVALILATLISQVVSRPASKTVQCGEEECQTACAMKTIGVMDSRGKISPAGIMRAIRSRVTADPPAIGQGKIVVMRCSIQANQESDACATILTFNRCVQMTTNKMLQTKTELPELNVTLPPLTFVLAMLSLLG